MLNRYININYKKTVLRYPSDCEAIIFSLYLNPLTPVALLKIFDEIQI